MNDQVACAALTRRGRPCRASPMAGRSYCSAHLPAPLEAIGGPWDGLTIRYHGALIALTFDPADREWPWTGRAPEAAVKEAVEVVGLYARQGDGWIWQRTEPGVGAVL